MGDAGPFLRAAADAMGLTSSRVIDTGLDPVTAEREQWDDGNNTLALAPRLCVAYERNAETNAQLERRRHRGDRDRRLGAGLRPRRPPLHVLPDSTRAALTSEPPARGRARTPPTGDTAASGCFEGKPYRRWRPNTCVPNRVTAPVAAAPAAADR